MGHPAQIVIIEDGAQRVVYDKGGGAPGMEFQILLDRERFTMDRLGDWRDDRWNPCSDAVYLVDHDRRVLLLSFIYLYDFPDEQAYRMLFLRLVRYVWKGWQVDWAYNGVEDVVAYLALDMSVLGAPRLSDPDFEGRLRFTPRTRPNLRMPEISPWRAGDRNYCLVTVEDGTRVRAYAVTPRCDNLLKGGPRVLDRLPEAARMTRCGSLPSSGVHFDLTTETGGYWTHGFIHGPLHEVYWSWPGWRWRFWEDDHTVQRALAGVEVTIPDPDVDTAMADLVRVWTERLDWDPDLAQELLREVLVRPQHERVAVLADAIFLLSD
ncbi:hypothetical protein AB0C21_14305 [Spirillospora sp. NPDC049024]